MKERRMDRLPHQSHAFFSSPDFALRSQSCTPHKHELVLENSKFKTGINWQKAVAQHCLFLTFGSKFFSSSISSAILWTSLVPNLFSWKEKLLASYCWRRLYWDENEETEGTADKKKNRTTLNVISVIILIARLKRASLRYWFVGVGSFSSFRGDGMVV